MVDVEEYFESSLILCLTKKWSTGNEDDGELSLNYQ